MRFILFIVLLFVAFSWGWYIGISKCMESQPSLPEKKNILPAFSAEISQLFFRLQDTVFASEEECLEGAQCSLPQKQEKLQNENQQKDILYYIPICNDALEKEQIKKNKREKKEEILFCVLENKKTEIVRAERWDATFSLADKSWRTEVIESRAHEYLVERFGKGNGRNTYYAVSKEGVMFPILGIKSFEGTGGTAVIYTPYSDLLRTKTGIDTGDMYVTNLISKAFDDISALQVPSRAYPGKVVGEVQRERQKMIVKAIIIDEQMDPDTFQFIGAYPLIERILVIFGLNKENAYSYNISPMDANGIGQFIAGTYERAVKECPKAKLNPFFVEGTRNHLNSVKAMICLIDSELNELDPKIKEQFEKDPRVVEHYIPAFYNGGSTRTQEFINLLGFSWDEFPQTSSSFIGKALMPETVVFLKKFKAIMHYLENNAVIK